MPPNSRSLQAAGQAQQAADDCNAAKRRVKELEQRLAAAAAVANTAGAAATSDAPALLQKRLANAETEAELLRGQLGRIVAENGRLKGLLDVRLRAPMEAVDLNMHSSHPYSNLAPFLLYRAARPWRARTRHTMACCTS